MKGRQVSLDIKQYQFYKKLVSLPFVEEIILYGSRARGDNQERSDIDLAIICPQASDVEWLEIKNIVTSADTLLHIDCVRFDALKPSSDLKAAIIKEGIKLHAKY